MTTAINLNDLDLYAHGAPHEAFRRLRHESPIYWNAEPDGPGFWAIMRHADVLTVSRDSETFSSERRGIMIFDESFETSGRERMMMEMDPPRHTEYRALVNRGLTPRRIAALEPFARDCFARALDRALEKGSCDFVAEVAASLPLQIITEMMGVPEPDRPNLGTLAHRVQGFDDPELGGGGGENIEAIADMSAYALDLARERRRSPKPDVASAILEAEIDGSRLDDDAFASFFLLLITAGIETTKSALSGGMLAFIEHPESWSSLERDRSGLPCAIEEVIRWTTPIHHFRRTATRDTTIADQPIRADERVVVWYSSANRDESVFPAPYRFDISREPNEHLSFGFGRHFCLGANLARLEMRVAYDTLLERGIEILPRGPVEYLRSNFTNSLKRMPVELRDRR